MPVILQESEHFLKFRYFLRSKVVYCLRLLCFDADVASKKAIKGAFYKLFLGESREEKKWNLVLQSPLPPPLPPPPPRHPPHFRQRKSQKEIWKNEFRPAIFQKKKIASATPPEDNRIQKKEERMPSFQPCSSLFQNYHLQHVHQKKSTKHLYLQ